MVPKRRHDSSEREDSDGRQTIFHSRSHRHTRRQNHGGGHQLGYSKTSGTENTSDRSAGTHGNPRLHRFSYSRDPGRTDVYDGSELGGRHFHSRGDEPDSRCFGGEEAGLLADRRGRLERGTVQGKATADSGGSRGRRAE